MSGNDVVTLQAAREALVDILRVHLSSDTQDLAGTYWDEDIFKVLLRIQEVLAAKQGDPGRRPCSGCTWYAGFSAAPDPLVNHCEDGPTPSLSSPD